MKAFTLILSLPVVLAYDYVIIGGGTAQVPCSGPAL